MKPRISPKIHIGRYSEIFLAKLHWDGSVISAADTKQHRARSALLHAQNAQKPSGIGISQSVRTLYYHILQSSIGCGFEAEQVRIIWRTASQAYSIHELLLALEGVFNKIYPHNTIIAAINNYPLPLDALEGKGSVAIRVLARLKAQHDSPSPTWIIESGLPELRSNRPEVPWVDFTYSLLDKLVEDELMTNSLRDKMFARDLGL